MSAIDYYSLESKPLNYALYDYSVLLTLSKCFFTILVSTNHLCGDNCCSDFGHNFTPQCLWDSRCKWDSLMSVRFSDINDTPRCLWDSPRCQWDSPMSMRLPDVNKILRFQWDSSPYVNETPWCQWDSPMSKRLPMSMRLTEVNKINQKMLHKQ